METLDPKHPNHILVGLGGTGGKVLKAIRKRLFSEFPNDEDRNKLSIGFVYVDSTNEMMTKGDPTFRVMGKDASFTESEFVNIKSVDLKYILDNISSFPGLKNIVKNGNSMKNTLGEVGQAAGQKRRAGRILFAANCNKYLACLKAQYNKVNKITGKDCVNIHIFTGLAGGTGSGAILDVISQTRSMETFKNANIMVYAMVPELNIPSGCQAGRYHQNGYAALKELNALNIGAFLPSDVITGKEHVDLNIIPNKQFGLMLYSNVNENGVVVDSFKELPQLLADTVYFRLFLQEKSGVTDDLLRSFSLENINDFCVEYSEKSKGDEKERARTKAINSFGIKRIIYPERRILEHITYTVGERVLLQMQYNNFKDDFGYVKEPMPTDYGIQYTKSETLHDWMLDDAHLMLEEGILETDKSTCEPIDMFWKEIVNGYSYKDAKSIDSEPLKFIENICTDAYKNNFRKKLGVEEYYKDRCDETLLKEYSRCIIEKIEQGLYTQWYEGQISLYDLMSICQTLLVYLKNRRDNIETDINKEDEQIEAFSKEADDNNYDYNHLSLVQRATGTSSRLYSDQQLILKDLFSARTRRKAYEFEAALLSKLRNAFEAFSDEVNLFIGVVMNAMDTTEKRIADRNKNNKGIADLSGAIIEVSEEEKMNKLEKDFVLDKTKQSEWASIIRKVIAGNKTYAHFGELARSVNDETIFDIFDTMLSPKVKVLHDQCCQNDKILGLNVLQQLQKILVTDTDIQNFASEVIEKSGVFLKMDDAQLAKALRNNPNPVSNPETINRKTILVSMPTDEGNDSLKAFANKLKNALQGSFGNSTPGCILKFDTSSERKNEITILSIRYCFPMRAIEWLPYYDQVYNEMIHSSNELDARESQILLHSEGDGSNLPNLMGEKKLTIEDFMPYLFLAAINNMISIKEDDVNGRGWCMVEKDMWDNEVLVFLASNFTDIVVSDNFSEDVMSGIVDNVDEILNNPELKISERTEMLQGVKEIMKNVISKECTSTTSSKYQQYSSAAMKAIELINKK